MAVPLAAHTTTMERWLPDMACGLLAPRAQLHPSRSCGTWLRPALSRGRDCATPCPGLASGLATDRSAPIALRTGRGQRELEKPPAHELGLGKCPDSW